jgi:hypothetical protein
LGKNETERKARFIVIKGESKEYGSAIRHRDEMQTCYNNAVNALKEAEDARREYEDAIAATLLEARYGLTIEPLDFIKMLESEVGE